MFGWRRGAAIGLAISLAGCGGAATTAPTSPSAGASPSVQASMEPTTNPNDGVPDPNGRIAFGRVVREDSFYGQVVAIWAIDPDGSDLVQLNDGDSGFPVWSPDSSRIAYTHRQADLTWQIETMAPDGSDVKVLTSGPGTDNASWSPDGDWIAYMTFAGSPSDADFHTTIWRMDADGSNAQLLGDPDAFDVEPKISPDGTKLLFLRLSFPGGGQRQQLFVRTIATGEELEITAVGTAPEHPAWSPDGDWILYNTNPNYGSGNPNDQVERIGAGGSGEPEVLFEGTENQGGFKPSYSPDGRMIVFGCFTEPAGTDALCVMNADGGSPFKLLDSEVHENHFSWGVTPPSS